MREESIEEMIVRIQLEKQRYRNLIQQSDVLFSCADEEVEDE